MAKAQYRFEIDSIKQVLKVENKDTSKINTLLSLGSYYEEVNPDSALIIYNNALQIALKLNNEKFLIDVYACLGDYYYSFSQNQKAIENYLLAIKQINLQQIANDSKQRIIKKKSSRIYANIGLVYLDMGDYEKALYYNKISLQTKELLLKTASDANEIKNIKKDISKAYNNFGSNYYYQGQFQSAIDYYLKSLKICEEISDKKGIARCYNNIGSVYSDLGIHIKALEYKQKSLKIFKELGDKKRIAGTYNNIGNCFSSLNDYPNAMSFYQKSLEMDKELNDKSGMALSHINIGELCIVLKDYEKAKQNYLKALSLTEELGDKNSQAIVFMDISELNILSKNYTNAIEKALLGLKIANEIKSLSIQKSAYQNLSIANENLGNFKDAYFYHKQYKQITDSIFNEKSGKQIKEMEARYNNEKNQKEIELLNKNQLLKDTEIRRQTTQKYAFIFGFILMLLLAFISYRSFVQKQKANKILAIQKNEIEEKNEELNQQNEEITSQRDEIEAQRETLSIQNNELEKVHNGLKSSIRYAHQIQSALLPSNKVLKELLNEYFVINKPCEIVSGDFYWIMKRNNWLLIAVADCTGHGVPGGFMSMLGVSFLHEIAAKDYINEAGKVLDELRNYIIKSLKQKGDIGEQKDGMDISFCALNTDTLELQFAGANNPIYIVTQFGNEKKNKFENLKMNQFEIEKDKNIDSMSPLSNYQINEFPNLIELKGDKMPVSIHVKMDKFTNNKFQLFKGDSIYMFTDGFADQFGGINGKKIKYSKFKELLLEINHLPMEKQMQELETAFNIWKGNLSQVDDVTILGIKI